MMIHEITTLTGRYKKRKRVGRGRGSGKGKTCGRGHNGARSRSGASGSIRASREGGQMPLFRRLPKRGFNNANFRTVFAIVNVKALAARFQDGDEVNAKSLAKAGLISDAKLPIKILGEGDIDKKLNVIAAAFSKSAMEKINAAGGSAQVK